MSNTSCSGSLFAGYITNDAVSILLYIILLTILSYGGSRLAFGKKLPSIAAIPRLDRLLFSYCCIIFGISATCLILLSLYITHMSGCSYRDATESTGYYFRFVGVSCYFLGLIGQYSFFSLRTIQALKGTKYPIGKCLQYLIYCTISLGIVASIGGIVFNFEPSWGLVVCLYFINMLAMLITLIKKLKQLTVNIDNFDDVVNAGTSEIAGRLGSVEVTASTFQTPQASGNASPARADASPNSGNAGATGSKGLDLSLPGPNAPDLVAPKSADIIAVTPRLGGINGGGPGSVPFGGLERNASIRAMNDIVPIMAKTSVLIMVAIVSSFVYSLLINSVFFGINLKIWWLMVGWAGIIEILVNVSCLVLTMPFALPYYEKVCVLCHKWSEKKLLIQIENEMSYKDTNEKNGRTGSPSPY